MRSFPILEVCSALLLMGAAYWAVRPYEQSRTIIANESQAMQVLKGIAKAQGEYHRANGGVRFGVLEEVIAHGTTALTRGRVSRGILTAGGYHFVIYLPTGEGQAVFRSGDVDPEHAGLTWVGFAWPKDYAVTGRRLFALQGGGQIHSLENSIHPFAGPEDIPPALLFGPLMDPNPFGRPPKWVIALRWRREG